MAGGSTGTSKTSDRILRSTSKGDSQELPERDINHKSKKMRKAEQKRIKRKNNRQSKFDKSRNLSGDSVSSSQSQQSESRHLSDTLPDSESDDPSSQPPSPPPSRTVSQMLGDVYTTTQTQSNASNTSDPDELANSKIMIEYLQKENKALKNERNLLHDDLNVATKLLDSFKKKCKNLTTQNDNLLRNASKKGSGMRQFTDRSHETSTQTDPASPAPSNLPAQLREATDLAIAEYNSTCDYVTQIAHTLLNAVSDAKISAVSPNRDNLPSNPTSNSRLNPSQPTPHVIHDDFQPVRHRKSRQPKPVTPDSEQMPIPVLQSGVAYNSKPVPRPPTYAQAAVSSHVHNQTTHRRPGQGARQRKKTVIVGSSLTDGLSSELNKLNVKSTTHIYRGGKLDMIRERIPHIFSNDTSKHPDKIVLLAGGNDAEETTADLTINAYEGLVRTVKQVCPHSQVIISSIPPRKNSRIINDKIKEVNDYLKDRGQRNDNVIFADAVPTESSMFTHKKVHFNSIGKSEFAQRLRPFLSN